jgi:uncharacterized protein YndB with AHSA1/START domain/DNA-binding transcriptional ArsR family regulator
MDLALDNGFAALSHPLRRDMLARLSAGRRTISDFTAGAGMTFAAVSRHLKVLEAAGLVSRKIEGREHFFAAEPKALAAPHDWIEAQSRRWQSNLDQLKSLMETDMTVPGPLVAHAEVHIAAPPEKVFAAWTDPKTAAKFIGGPDATVDGLVLEARPGGELYVPMKFADRMVLHRGEILAVDAPRRLVFTWISQHTMLRTTVVAVDFIAKDGGTDVVLTHEGFVVPEDAKGHTGGWTAILGQLKAAL